MTGLTQKQIIRRDAAASALHFEIARNVRQIVYCWYSKIVYSYHVSDFVINFSLSLFSQLYNNDISGDIHHLILIMEVFTLFIISMFHNIVQSRSISNKES